MIISREAAFTCCASAGFASKVADASPYSSWEAAVSAARQAWWGLPMTEWLAAFSAHPRIGGGTGSKTGTTAFAAHSREEQAAASSSLTPDVEAELAHWNEAYFAKFGHVFLICARGKPSPYILDCLKSRCV